MRLTLLIFGALMALANATSYSDMADEEFQMNEIPVTYEMPDEFRRQMEVAEKLTVNQMIERHGYPSETHQVLTKDGYILTMYRVPRNRANDPITRGSVLVMHGLLASACDWAVMGPDESIAYMLSNAGYDVWMGNARGNTFSRNHTSIKPHRPNFWQFSWNEIGLFDLPAMIDYILETTGETKLSYVGHSQGTTAFFVMASEKPEYNAKIKSMHALAPVAYMSHMQSPLIRMLSPFVNQIDWLTSMLGMNEFLPSSRLLATLGDKICKDESSLQFVCRNVLFLLAGFNPEQLNATALPAILAHIPAGSATKQLVHYGQLVNSAKFRKFDYGLIKNLREYGKSKPPAYQLKRVTCPVALHYSDNDWMANPKDVDILSKELSNVIGKFRIPDKNWNHLDFLWGIDADDLVYAKVISVMNRYA